MTRIENPIHVEWDGPHTFDEAKNLQDESADYGVYQVSGAHPARVGWQ